MKRVSLLLFITALLCLSTNNLNAQSDTIKGIHFLNDKLWEKIKEQSRSNHKLIFVDCYATWCKPCKEMDNKIYVDSTVGKFVNDRFVSVKIQMDSTLNDNEDTKIGYALAQEFDSHYRITSLPTYLFFNQEGELVHKGIGSMSKDEFLKLTYDALDSNKQVFRQVTKWENGLVPFNEMPTLAKKIWFEYNDRKLSVDIANDYIYNYLYKLPDSVFLRQENFTFIVSYGGLIKIEDRIFKICYNNPNAVNLIMQDSGYSTKVINYIIAKSILIPALNSADSEKKEPNWNSLLSEIISSGIKYKVASENIVNGKVMWFRGKKDWGNYIIYLNEQIEHSYAFANWGMLNGAAWDVFQHSNSKLNLNKALNWSTRSIGLAQESDSSQVTHLMDTKANLLYKLGRKKEAIALYKKIIARVPNNKSYKDTIERMRKGERTWLQEDY